MKKLYLLQLFVVFMLASSAQHYVEKSFNYGLSSTITSTAKDSAGNIMVAGYSYRSFHSPNGILFRINSNGVIDHFSNLTNVVSFFNDIIQANDQNYLLCGQVIPCDVVPWQWGVVSKHDENGNLIWNKEINPDTTFASQNDNKLKKIAELSNQNILVIGDSTLYCLNSNGDSVWTKFIGSNLNELESDGMKILLGKDDSLLFLDANGNNLSQVQFASNVNHIRTLNGLGYLVAAGNVIHILDTTLNVVTQYDLSPVNFTTDLIAIDTSSISVANELGNAFISFDYSLNITDSFRIQSADVVCNSLVLHDSTLTILGNESTYKSCNYFKTLSVHGNYDYFDNDIGILSVRMDTIYSYDLPGNPPGIDAFGFIPVVTIINNGTDTIDRVNINSIPLVGYPPCGHSPWIDVFTSLALLPGDSVDLTLNLKSESPVSFFNPVYYNYCVWTSSPDSLTDKFHANDYYCDSFYVSGVGINDPDNYLFSIFPNPAGDVLNIKINRPESQDTRYVICNSVNQVVSIGVLANEMINIENLENGFYFLSLINGDKKNVIKFVKIGD